MTEKRKRQKFTPEFKSDAVKLVTDNGYTCREAARRLGIGASNITRWVCKDRDKHESRNRGEKPHREREAENKRLQMEREILKKRDGLLCKRVELRFDFIRQQMKAYPVTVLCKVMKVSRSGFYDYLRRFNNGTDEDPEQAALTARIHAIFKEHRSKYGSRRILNQLKEEGFGIGRYKVRRIMKDLGLKAKISRRFKVTTDSRHSFPVAPNVLNRNFDVAAPNKVWTADISYVWTFEGW
jgi:putative transposase